MNLEKNTIITARVTAVHRERYQLVCEHGEIYARLKTKEYYGADKVIPIMICLDDGERLQRALDREKGQECPKYSEMCRRFLADEEDFSLEKKREAGIDREFVNENLEQCLEEIEQYISSYL